MTKGGIYAENLLTPYFESLKDYKVLSKDEEKELFQRINEKEDDFILHLASKREIFQEALAKAVKNIRGEDEDSHTRFQRLLTEKKIVKSLFLKFCREDGRVRSVQEDLYFNIESKFCKKENTWFQELQFKRQELQSIRNEFAHHNLRLVISMAKRYSGFAGSLKLTDLVQEGNLGLMKAIEKFDSSKEVKFSTYASWWIKQSMRRALHDKNKTIRLPVHVAENANKIRRVTFSFLAQHGRKPTEKELIRETGFTKNLIDFILNNEDIFAPDVSLDKPVGEDGDFSLVESLEGNNESVEESIYQTELFADLDRAMTCLTPREAFIVRNRFNHDMTLQEIGEKYSVSRERIRQLETIALNKLKRHPNIKRHRLFFS